jgi:hypothetical protein
VLVVVVPGFAALVPLAGAAAVAAGRSEPEGLAGVAVVDWANAWLATNRLVIRTGMVRFMAGTSPWLTQVSCVASNNDPERARVDVIAS